MLEKKWPLGRSSFSNWGACVKILAPGSSITAAWSDSDTITKTISGTSMATPLVSGAVALIRAERPNFDSVDVVNALNCMATRDVLTTLPSGTPNRLLYTGAAAAVDSNLDCEFPPLPPPPPLPAPFPPTGQLGEPIDVEIVIFPDSYPEETSWVVKFACDTTSGGGPYSCDSAESIIELRGSNGVGRMVRLVKGASFTFEVWHQHLTG